MSPADAVKHLRRVAMTSGETSDAIAILLDHIVQLEQQLSLIESAMVGALRNVPQFAALAVGRDRPLDAMRKP